jgi:hypothetical protein
MFTGQQWIKSGMTTGVVCSVAVGSRIKSGMTTGVVCSVAVGSKIKSA